MEDNIVMINGKSDLEKNLVIAENPYTSQKNHKKNIAYGVIGLLLVSCLIGGIYFIGIQQISTPIMRQSAQPQTQISSNEAQLQQEVKSTPANETPVKEGPKNYQFLPDTFDVRTQASSIKCNFGRPDEMLCVGGNWSYTITSTISNTICTQSMRNPEVPLSNQYLLNCSGLSNKCDTLNSREDFEAQLKVISEQGVPTSQCVPYNGLNYKVQPNSCNTNCNDQTTISVNKYNLVSLWDSNDDMNATIQNVKSHLYNYGPVVALLKHSATVARYSGSDPNGIFVNDPTDQTNFGYRAYKIVAWNLAPGDTPTPFWVMGNTFSSNWGISGYLHTTLNEPIIEGYYGYVPSQ